MAFMSEILYSTIIIEVWKKIQEYIHSRKANEKELRELQEKLGEAIKFAHDSAITGLQYLTPLVMTTKANTCVVEIKTILKQIRAYNSPPYATEYYPGVTHCMSSLHRRLFRVKHEVEKIYELREDYEKALGHINRAFKHHDRARVFFDKADFKSSLEETELIENETEELGSFLERRLRERMQPIIDTYKLLSK
jgi:tetratricopeptide (TPR) repeat protein